jgi:CDP-glycerol glycerophosphotransferase (TagB/SpsB family)
MSAIRSLFQKPSSVECPMRFVLKPHPDLADLALLRSLGERIEHAVLPPDVPLDDALRSSELVIALNYSGVGIVHAALQSKPVIFYWTDPCIGETEPCTFGDIYLPCGPLVRTADELWRQLDRFWNDPAYAQSLRDQVRTFAAGWLDNGGCPTVGEIVEAVLSRSKATPGFAGQQAVPPVATVR